MPFTLSHIAASLPLLNRSKAVGWKTALVAGTLVPDLLFPIPYFGERHLTHSLLGLFVLDVPVAFAVAAVWNYWLSKRLSRLPGLEPLGRHDPAVYSVPLALLGALVGACTHLVWDMFTHQGSPLLDHDFFYRPLFPGNHGAVMPQTLIWYFNSIAGLAVLVAWMRKRLHEQGFGMRTALLSGAWVRVYAGFLLPYLFILGMVVEGRPTRLSQLVINLAYLVDPVRTVMFVSIFSALAVAIWESREGGLHRKAPVRTDR